MQEKEKTTINDFEDLGPDTDFAEFEAQEKNLKKEAEEIEKSAEGSSDKAPKKSAKKKTVQNDEDETSEDMKSDGEDVPVSDTEASADAEMKELFVALPPDCTADSFTISINLKSYVIKYGEPNMVPKHVYDYYQTMQKQKSDHLKVQRALQG